MIKQKEKIILPLKPKGNKNIEGIIKNKIGEILEKTMKKYNEELINRTSFVNLRQVKNKGKRVKRKYIFIKRKMRKKEEKKENRKIKLTKNSSKRKRKENQMIKKIKMKKIST